MPTNLELQEMIEKIAQYLKEFIALIDELFGGLSLKYNGYTATYADDAKDGE